MTVLRLFLAESRKRFTQCPKRATSFLKLCKKIFSPNCSYGRIECDAENWSTKGWKKLDGNPNVIKKPQFFQNYFSYKRSDGHRECKYHSFIEFFLAESWETFAQFPKILNGLIIFFGKALFFEHFIRKLESRFGNLVESFAT